MKLYTIGYEGALQPDLIARLKAAGVRTLVDVRAVAASRRAGFSKTLLGNSLAEAGIDYVHLRGVGTPKAGREAALAGRIAELHERQGQRGHIELANGAPLGGGVFRIYLP